MGSPLEMTLLNFVRPPVVRRLHIHNLIFVVIAIILSGCNCNEEAYVTRIVTSVGPSTLLADAARLASEYPDKEGFRAVNPAILPASFIDFMPVETLRYERSFFIVTARWLQHRTGVFVQPLDYPEPTGAGHGRYYKLAPGIYFYSS